MKANSKNKSAQQYLIEQEIDSIFRILTSTYGDKYVLSKERADKGGCCKGLVKLTGRHDLKRQALEAADYRTAIRNGSDPETLHAPYTAKPERLYAFYPATTEPARLGSIAIYGKNITIEKGIRP